MIEKVGTPQRIKFLFPDKIRKEFPRVKSSHQSNNLVRLSESAPAYIKKFLCPPHCVPSPLTHMYSTSLLSLLNTSHPGFIHAVLLGFILRKILRKFSIIQSELPWPFRVHPSRNYSVKYSSSSRNSSSFTNNLSRSLTSLRRASG